MTCQLVAGTGSTVRLSVVIPAYNASKHIAECLTSVLAQEDSPPYEVIVVDDGSRDETADIVAREFPSVRLVPKSNGGPGSARNRGVAEARGEVIVFIDADDVMLPGRLAFQGGFMLANPRFGLTFGNQQNSSTPFHDQLFVSGFCESFDFVELDQAYGRLLAQGYFPNPASAVRREAYISCGGQPEDFFTAEDFVMACSISRSWPVAVCRRFLTWYRQGHGGNLMASPYAYCDPVRAIINELTHFGHLVDETNRAISLKRGRAVANMYLRWIWIERGRDAVLEQIDKLNPVSTPLLSLKWKLITLLPSGIGRTIRTIKRAGCN